MNDHPGTRVTCVDQQSGETESTLIKDNHVVVTDGRSFISSVVAHANGTQVVTIKRAKTVDEARSHQPRFTRNFPGATR